eukprot:5802262-Karenia_brevis.AAC.1
MAKLGALVTQADVAAGANGSNSSQGSQVAAGSNAAADHDDLIAKLGGVVTKALEEKSASARPSR